MFALPEMVRPELLPSGDSASIQAACGPRMLRRAIAPAVRRLRTARPRLRRRWNRRSRSKRRVRPLPRAPRGARCPAATGGSRRCRWPRRRPGRVPAPARAPARERADHGQQLAGALGQLVVDPRRHLAVALAGEQAVGDHPVQARAQLLGGDPGRTRWSSTKRRGPAARSRMMSSVHLSPTRSSAPGIGRPLVIGMALRWRYWCDGMSRGWEGRSAMACGTRGTLLRPSGVITGFRSRAVDGCPVLGHGDRH